jgi:dihydroorotase
MAEQVDLIVRNGTVVTSQSTREADMAIRDGRFVEIAPPGQLDATAAEEYDATGLHVLPGVIDGHVHFRDPGLEYKEDWGTGSHAAVMGGVTTVFDCPTPCRPPGRPPTRASSSRSPSPGPTATSA